jgi:hypothetical protein
MPFRVDQIPQPAAIRPFLLNHERFQQLVEFRDGFSGGNDNRNSDERHWCSTRRRSSIRPAVSGWQGRFSEEGVDGMLHAPQLDMLFVAMQ